MLKVRTNSCGLDLTRVLVADSRSLTLLFFRFVVLVWEQLHEHLVSKNNDGNACAALDDEQLCEAVEHDLVERGEPHRDQYSRKHKLKSPKALVTKANSSVHADSPVKSRSTSRVV